MDGAIEKYKLEKLYVLFSGGKDSSSTLHYVATNYPKQFAGAVFTNVGLGSQVTRRFVIEYCHKNNYPLTLLWPRERDRFYNVVMRFGFASTATHQQWMGMLKYHSWERFIRDALNGGEKAAFISGVRKKESWARNKRRLYTKKPVDLDGRIIFIKPFLYKNGLQLMEYFYDNELKRSPTYQWLDKSGECYCGAFAENWELKMMEKYDPFAFKTIQWLEAQIQLHGSKKAKIYNKWGNGPPTALVKDQKNIEDYCGESCQIT